MAWLNRLMAQSVSALSIFFACSCTGVDGVGSAVVEQLAVADHLHEHYAAQVFNHLGNEFSEASSLEKQLVDQCQAGGYIFGRQGIDKCGYRFTGGAAQDLLHLFQGDCEVVIPVGEVGAVAGHLIEETYGVAHTALCATGNGEDRGFLDFETLFGSDVRQVGCDFGDRYAAEVEALAAAENGCGNAMGFGRREYETSIGGWLFERFQQGVECAGAEHVYFVDDVDLVAGLARLEADLFAEFSNVVDTVVAGSVDFDEVQHATFVDGGTVVAAVTGLVLLVGAVQCFGKDSGGGGLAGAAGSGEQVGMCDPPVAQRVEEGGRHVFLAYDLVKGLATPFAVQRLCHVPRSNWTTDPGKSRAHTRPVRTTLFSLPPGRGGGKRMGDFGCEGRNKADAYGDLLGLAGRGLAGHVRLGTCYRYRHPVDEGWFRGGVAGAEPPHKGGPTRPDRP